MWREAANRARPSSCEHGAMSLPINCGKAGGEAVAIDGSKLGS